MQARSHVMNEKHHVTSSEKDEAVKQARHASIEKRLEEIAAMANSHGVDLLETISKLTSSVS